MNSEGLKSTANNDVCGVLIVNKHAGVTSFDIVRRVGKLYGTKKVGHAGTLDPLATGVLVVLLGRAAKAEEYLAGGRKSYRALMRLGVVSDTEDISGNLTVSDCALPSRGAVEDAARGFVGEISQIPPMYSALKVGGKKLYEIARSGRTVERAPRKITVYSLTVSEAVSMSEYVLDVECSGGTYIRTLCADIGRTLGCGAVMAELERTAACGFSLDEAFGVSELEKMSAQERLSVLKPVECLFDDLPTVRLNDFFTKLCRSGCAVRQEKLGICYEYGTRLKVCDGKGKFFALGEIVDADGAPALKALKLFEL